MYYQLNKIKQMTNIEDKNVGIIKTQDGYTGHPLTTEELEFFNKDLTEVLQKHSVGFFPVIIPTADLSTVKAVIHQYKLIKDEETTTKDNNNESTREEVTEA